MKEKKEKKPTKQRTVSLFTGKTDLDGIDARDGTPPIPSDRPARKPKVLGRWEHSEKRRRWEVLSATGS